MTGPPTVVADNGVAVAIAPGSNGSVPLPHEIVAASQQVPTTSVIATRGDDAPEPTQRRITRFKPSDMAEVVGSALSAAGLTWLIFAWFLPLTGVIGALLVWYVAFLAVYAVAVRIGHEGPVVKDRLAAVAIHSFALMLFAVLVVIIVFTLMRGWEALPHPNFFTQDMSNAGPLDPITVGGILHAVVGTLIMISIALAIVVPLGITCAVFLTEVPGRFSQFVGTITTAMTALPSIVAGLFIYATLILTLGFEKSGFAAAMAISVMMLPIIVRAADVVLRLVPGTLKEASYAVGSSHWRTVWHVVLPTARSGLTTAVILGAARGIGETSPVLLTAGFTAALNFNPFSGPMVSLPLETFQLVKSPQPNFIVRGFGTAAVLLTLVLILFVIARLIGGRGPGALSERGLKRRARKSAHDLGRFERRVAEAAAPKIRGAQLASLGSPAPVLTISPPVGSPAPGVAPHNHGPLDPITGGTS
jgi:phosphate transport system permease protein